MTHAADLSPYTRLHTFAVLRDLIRKWWKLELFLIDQEGEPVPEGAPAAWGGLPRPIAPDNDFCRLSLHTPPGARRCADSLRVTVDKLRTRGRAERCVIHDCHLGFGIVACSLFLDGALGGAVVVSGLSGEPLGTFSETQLLRKLREIAPAAGNGTDIDRALRRVPLLAQVEIEQICDLLTLCADEISFHHAERTGPRAVPPEPLPLPRPLVGASLPMQRLWRAIDSASRSPLPALITGEEGTGKELVAFQIHDRGPRREHPFQVQDCAHFSAAALHESLFGEGGAFAPVPSDTLSAPVPPGTLLLDEVGALPLDLQDRLLAQLSRPGPRVLATTSQDLSAQVERGTFLPALYDRLTALRLPVPPLRERPEDVALLCAHFLADSPAAPLPGDILQTLESHPWPGNVRELMTELGRLDTLCRARGGTPDLADLSPRIRQTHPSPSHPPMNSER